MEIIPSGVRKIVLSEELRKFEDILKSLKNALVRYLEREKNKNKKKMIEEFLDKIVIYSNFHRSFLTSFIKTGSESDKINASESLNDLLHVLHELENEALRIDDRNLYEMMKKFEMLFFEYDFSLHKCFKELKGIKKKIDADAVFGKGDKQK